MPESSLCAGGRVKMKHGGKIWTGTVAAARKKSAASRFIQGSYLRSIWSRQSTTSAIFFPTCQRIGTMLFLPQVSLKKYFPLNYISLETLKRKSKNLGLSLARNFNLRNANRWAWWGEELIKPKTCLASSNQASCTSQKILRIDIRS